MNSSSSSLDLGNQNIILTLDVSNAKRSYDYFRHKQTERTGERVKKLPPEIQNTGRRKLRMINNAVDLQDLRTPPANRLERLIGR